MTTRFDGRTALVTGGAGGLGRAVVRRLADDGARVVVADLHLEAASAVAADVPGASAVALDVTSEESWDKAWAEAGDPDVLVNCAGWYSPGIAFEDMSLAEWRRHLAVNADGTFLACRFGITRMRPGGSVVTIGSGMSVNAISTASAYCASKAAVLMTTRTAAIAGGRRGVRVNCVLPGAVPTDMLMKNVRPGQGEAEFLEEMRAVSPLGVLATPDDIAAAVAYLADPAAAAVTGVALPVDGGALLGTI